MFIAPHGLNNPSRYTDPNGHKASDEVNNPPPPYLPTQTPAAPIIILPKPSQQINPEQTVVQDNSDSLIIGYQYSVNWNEVDWADVFISGVGIAGDVGLVSTLAGFAPGPAVWGVTEVVEFIEDAGMIYDGYNALGGDYSGVSLSTGEDIFKTLSSIPSGGGKAFTRTLSLAPAVGSIFDVANIAWNIFVCTERTPIEIHAPMEIGPRK